jgi:hypothetical protein
MLQIIKYKPLTLRYENIEYNYVKPKYLIKIGSLKLIEAKVKGSTMVWNLGDNQLSYNQIKKAIINAIQFNYNSKEKTTWLWVL